MKRTGVLLAVSVAIAAAAPCFAQCRFAPGGRGRILSYVFDPTVNASGTVLHVTLRFRGGAADHEQLEVPAHWAGETLHGIVNIHALSPDTVIENETVRHPPNQEVVLAYDIVKDWTGRFRHPAEFHGALMPEYIEVNGSNALVYPKLDASTPVTVHFDWQGLPAAWVLATSFGAGSTPGDRCQTYSGTWLLVQDALFTAGEFRLHHFKIGTQPAVLAVRGEWTFTDDEAIADLQKSVGAVRAFWHDDHFPYYLVTLKPFDNDSGDGDGTALTNSYWLYLSRRDSISDQLPVLVHETFHGWNPRRMGIEPGGGVSIEWFREGFTSYYGYLLAYRAGLIQLPAYVENINGDLRKSAGAANAYVRGRLIALWLDRQIRKDSRGRSSLDNVMYDMVKAAAKPLTEARILETAGRYLSAASRGQLAAAVKPDAPSPVAADALGPCVPGSVVEIPTFSPGFDLAGSRASGIVSGVAPDGPAFVAGLRDGQEMSGRLSIYNNQPDKSAIVTIRSADGPRPIEYFPRGRAAAVLQYHLDERAYAANATGCGVQ